MLYLCCAYTRRNIGVSRVSCRQSSGLYNIEKIGIYIGTYCVETNIIHFISYISTLLQRHDSAGVRRMGTPVNPRFHIPPKSNII